MEDIFSDCKGLADAGYADRSKHVYAKHDDERNDH